MDVVAEIYDAFRAAQGVTDDQARSAAAAVVSARTLGDTATKADLTELEARLSRVMITTLIALTAIYAGIVAMLKFH